MTDIPASTNTRYDIIHTFSSHIATKWHIHPHAHVSTFRRCLKEVWATFTHLTFGMLAESLKLTDILPIWNVLGKNLKF